MSGFSLVDFFHVLNPNDKERAAVKKFFDAHPELNCVWVERTSHPTHVETIVEWALNEGHIRLAVWAGDGTFSRVVQALFSLKGLDRVTLSLIPAGTGNDFARRLSGETWPAVVEKLRGSASVRKFDVGVLETGAQPRAFVNNAGFGRSEAALLRRPQRPLKDIFEFERKALHLAWREAGGERSQKMASFLGIVFNSPYFNKGMYFSKDISPDDGLLNGFFVPAQPKIRLLATLLRSRWGAPLSDKKTLRVDSPEISISSDKDLFVQADGEPASMRPVRDVRFSVRPRTLSLLWPNS